MNKYAQTSIKRLTQQYQTGGIVPCDMIKECFHRIRTTKNDLNAFITLTESNACEESNNSTKRYQNKIPKSLLDGIPIAVKDNFCTKNIRTTCASRMLQDFVPSYNATVYERLHESGAILIGKTNLDEFGMGSGTVDSCFGPTKNVWNTNLNDPTNWYIAGGSSGGSAVSVAAGFCYAAIGSDTGGSTRNPASYCGTVGLKPTYGLVSRHGLIPLVNSMDVPGILTRYIDDCALILNAIAGPDARDSTTLRVPFKPIQLPSADDIQLNGLRIGIPVEYHCNGLTKDVIETWTKVADLLEDAGAQVKQISLPNTAASIFVYSILNQCEVASNMARYDGLQYGHRCNDENLESTEQLYAQSRATGFNAVVKNRILSGNFYLLRRNYDKYFAKALKVRRLILNDFTRAFDEVDVILTPTTLSDAPRYLDFVQSANRDQCAVQDFCTQPANMAGIPALTIPIRHSSNGLPISIQLMGRNLSEDTLLRTGKWIENQVEFKFFHGN